VLSQQGLHYQVQFHRCFFILHRAVAPWPVRKENEVALQRAEMTMVRWMCGINVKDRAPSEELRGKLGLDDIISVIQQNRLHCMGMCC